MKYGVGIDVSKGKSTICIISSDGEVIEPPFEVKHVLDSLNELDRKLLNYRKSKVKILMEDTGQYNYPIEHFLIDRGYTVIKENPCKLKILMSKDMRIKKTDNRDSIKLANCCLEYWDKFIFNKKLKKNVDVYDQLRFLSRHYVACRRFMIQQKVNFSILCDNTFPGFYELIYEENYCMAVEIFKKYYLPSLILKYDKEEFVDRVTRLGIKFKHKKMSNNLAHKLYNLALNSVAIIKNSKHLKTVVQWYSDSTIDAINRCQYIISEMKELAKVLPEYEVLSNLPGCKDILGVLFIAELGDIRRFKNSSSIISYAGIDTPIIQSGKMLDKNVHITKKGNKHLRSTGYYIVEMIYRNYDSSNPINQYIYKKISEGKHIRKAKIAGLNKFFKIYYGIIKKRYTELGIWDK